MNNDRKLSIIALGDSTTAGTPGFLSPLEAPPSGRGDEKSQYTYWIAQKHSGWSIKNQGIAGQRSDEIRMRFENSLKEPFPDAVIVLAGVNDLYQGYSVNHVKKELEKIYFFAAKRKIRVIACTILPYNGSSKLVKNRMDEVNAWIRDFSGEHGLLFCDTHQAAMDPQKPGNLAGTLDDIHPNIETYRRIGEAIAKVLEENLEIT